MTMIDNSKKSPAFRLMQYLLLLVPLYLMGCDNTGTQSAAVQNGGSIAGNVYLSTKDLQTGNAGVLVYLGGTHIRLVPTSKENTGWMRYQPELTR